MLYKSAYSNHVCNCSRKDSDPIVQNGLSLTPARMLELTRQGFSINAQNSRMLQDVSPAPFRHMDVPIEFTRGFDIADGYMAQQDFRKKVKDIKLEKGD